MEEQRLAQSGQKNLWRISIFGRLLDTLVANHNVRFFKVKGARRQTSTITGRILLATEQIKLFKKRQKENARIGKTLA